MHIEEMDCEGCSFIDGLYCNEHSHSRKAVFVLKSYGGGFLIPMCQDCVDELYKELAEYVSPEVRDANKKG